MKDVAQAVAFIGLGASLRDLWVLVVERRRDKRARKARDAFQAKYEESEPG